MLYMHIKGILFSLERKEILTRATAWMNFEDLMLSGTSQSQKDNHCIIPLI